MVLEDIQEFFTKVPPFQFLAPDAIRRAAENVSVEYYPKQTYILKQDGQPSDYLQVIKKGGVKVFLVSAGGEEIVIDYRGEGESFGLLSLIGGDKSRANVVAAEDTICYLIRRDVIMSLMDESPAFTEYFLKSFFNKFIDKTYQEIQGKSPFTSGTDKLLFSTPVGELANREVCAAPLTITIQEAAAVMTERRISCLVLTDENGLPGGIVTDRDLREKVVSVGRDVRDPIRDIMSVSLIKADAREYCFEALLKMIKYNIHHLLIVDNGRLRGIITNHDLMLLQGISPLSVTREIEGQQTLEGLIPAARTINSIIGLLLKEGARASNITRIITEINDRLLRKIIGLAERKVGPSPVAYCWIALGSEGRKEQTFKTDQDNAIIYEDAGADQDAAAREYFAKLTEIVSGSLKACGFAPCPANYMASNPQWCQPLRVWKRYFSGWIDEPTPDAVLKSLIFFDFRAVTGNTRLADELRESLMGYLENKKVFFGYLANMVVRNSPPIGFLKTFVVEKDGEHKDELNLKIKGLAPIVDIVRLFSLERGIRATSTIERLHALKPVHTLAAEYADELENAFEFVMLLRIHHQFGQLEAGETVDNFINPKTLSSLEKRMIREAFKLITKMQDLIVERYRAMIM